MAHPRRPLQRRWISTSRRSTKRRSAADDSSFFGRKKRRRAVLAQLTDVLAVAPETVKLKSLSAITAKWPQTFQVVNDIRCASRECSRAA